MTTLLLVHGWGFDARLWDAVRDRLPEGMTVQALDLGFFGAPDLEVPEAVDVAAGHSLGLLWLLTRRPCRWRRLVSINGFPRFTAAPDFPDGVPPRLVARMRRRLETDPEAVLTDFRARCGAGPADRAPDPVRLAEGLALLAEGDGRAHVPPVGIAALAGEADPVVPPAMTAAAFPGACMIAGAGHLLPSTHAADVAAFLIRECSAVHE